MFWNAELTGNEAGMVNGTGFLAFRVLYDKEVHCLLAHGGGAIVLSFILF